MENICPVCEKLNSNESLMKDGWALCEDHPKIPKAIRLIGAIFPDKGMKNVSSSDKFQRTGEVSTWYPIDVEKSGELRILFDEWFACGYAFCTPYVMKKLFHPRWPTRLFRWLFSYQFSVGCLYTWHCVYAFLQRDFV